MAQTALTEVERRKIDEIMNLKLHVLTETFSKMEAKIDRKFDEMLETIRLWKKNRVSNPSHVSTADLIDVLQTKWNTPEPGKETKVGEVTDFVSDAAVVDDASGKESSLRDVKKDFASDTKMPKGFVKKITTTGVRVVDVAGYWGNTSISNGVVSWVEPTQHVQGPPNLMAVQTAASIDSGNSYVKAEISLSTLANNFNYSCTQGVRQNALEKLLVYFLPPKPPDGVVESRFADSEIYEVGLSNPYVVDAPVPVGSSQFSLPDAKNVGGTSRKIEVRAGQTWQHLQTSPSFADAAMSRIAQGTNVLAEGGYQKVLYVSPVTLAFWSNNPKPADDQSSRKWFAVGSKMREGDKWPTPATLNQLRGLLEFTGYFRSFVRIHGVIVCSLNQLLRTGVFLWSSNANASFGVLKRALCGALVLVLPYIYNTFLMESVVCDHGISFLLLQDGTNFTYISSKTDLRSLRYLLLWLQTSIQLQWLCMLVEFYYVIWFQYRKRKKKLVAATVSILEDSDKMGHLVIVLSAISNELAAKSNGEQTPGILHSTSSINKSTQCLTQIRAPFHPKIENEKSDQQLPPKKPPAEVITMDLFKKCMDSVDRCLKDAKLDKDIVLDIVLVGGSTMDLDVQQLLRDFFIGMELEPPNEKAYQIFPSSAILVSNLGRQSGFLIPNNRPHAYFIVLIYHQELLNTSIQNVSEFKLKTDESGAGALSLIISLYRQNLIKCILHICGNIDVLVSNAATKLTVIGVLELEESVLVKSWNIIFNVGTLVLQEATPHMFKGSLVIHPHTFLSMYSVPKTSILGLTKGLAATLTLDSRVNCVARKMDKGAAAGSEYFLKLYSQCILTVCENVCETKLDGFEAYLIRPPKKPPDALEP